MPTHTFPPPHLLFLKPLIRSATRLVTLPDCHPLYGPTQRAINRPVKRHRSPLHLLLATTEIKRERYETILSARRRRNYRMLGEVHTDDDRETAIEHANRITGTAIYTDGSGHDKKIGAAAVMMKHGGVSKTLKYYLGTETTHTVYEAEAVAIILALHMLTELKMKVNRVTIGTDNQAVLLGMQNQKSKPGHHLMDRIHDALEDFQVTQARIRGERIAGYKKGQSRMHLEDGSVGWKEWNLRIRCEVKFVWTPGHEGIEGNEKADTAAKDAATGVTSETKKLPAFLRHKPLPVSVSSTRQLLKKRMKNKWKTEWNASPRHANAKAIDESTPSDNYLHIIDQLHRNQASLLIQLRTGHIPLNVVLHRIKRSETPDCPHCKNRIRETAHHLLLRCPHYANARRSLREALPRDSSSIPFLLNARNGIPHLLRYISNTNRLKATFGEVRPADDFVLKEKEVKEKPQSCRNHDESE